MFPAFFKFQFAAAVLAAVLLSGGGAIAEEEEDACTLTGGGAGREIVAGRCVPTAVADALDKCHKAGWGSFSQFVIGAWFLSCVIPIRNFADYQSSGGGAGDAGSCGIYASGGGILVSPCKPVFGAGFDFPENDGNDESDDQNFVYNCPDMMIPDPDYVSGDVQECVPWDDEKLCRKFGGEVEDADSGSEKICSAVDANDTFCIVGSDSALPCRGLLKHVLQCNFDHNRPALNPFFCGARCGEKRVAKGASCPCAAGFEENADGSACVQESQ